MKKKRNSAVRCEDGFCQFVRMFKPQFAELVESGEKVQTVRPTPKRIPKAGDKISLRAWTGKPYRSKQRVLRESTITKVEHVEIRATEMYLGGRWIPFEHMHAFARADGFTGANDMIGWFNFTHGLPFRGVVIYWQNAALCHEAGRKETNE